MAKISNTYIYTKKDRYTQADTADGPSGRGWVCIYQLLTQLIDMETDRWASSTLRTQVTVLPTQSPGAALWAIPGRAHLWKETRVILFLVVLGGFNPGFAGRFIHLCLAMEVAFLRNLRSLPFSSLRTAHVTRIIPQSHGPTPLTSHVAVPPIRVSSLATVPNPAFCTNHNQPYPAPAFETQTVNIEGSSVADSTWLYSTCSSADTRSSHIPLDNKDSLPLNILMLHPTTKNLQMPSNTITLRS